MLWTRPHELKLPGVRRTAINQAWDARNQGSETLLALRGGGVSDRATRASSSPLSARIAASMRR